MLRFLRQIRQRLFTEKKFTKYFLYAIGEILLVVIGILIALQVNNWQTQKDKAVLEKNLLLGINEDLKEDRAQIENRFRRSNRDFNRNVELFDSLRKVNDRLLEITYMDSIFARCLRQRNTFFPVTGTYKTVINNGLSDVIRNKDLFKRIQQVYEKQYVSMVKSGDRADDLSDRIRFELRDLMGLSDQDRLAFYKSPSSRNDVELWKKHMNNFAMNLEGIDEGLIRIIEEIEKELQGE